MAPRAAWAASASASTAGARRPPAAGRGLQAREIGAVPGLPEQVDDDLYDAQAHENREGHQTKGDVELLDPRACLRFASSGSALRSVSIRKEISISRDTNARCKTVTIKNSGYQRLDAYELVRPHKFNLLDGEQFVNSGLEFGSRPSGDHGAQAAVSGPGDRRCATCLGRDGGPSLASTGRRR